MGQLGNLGYGVYNIDGLVFVVHPTGCKIYRKRNAEDSLLEEVLEQAEEEDCYMDYKLNRSFYEGNDS